MSRESNNTTKGFSLLELMVSMVIMLAISGALMSALSSYQKSYASTQLQAGMHQDLRSAAEMMTQEIGQAGAVGLPPSTTLSAAVGTSILAQSVPVSSSAGIFVGEKLLVDAGPSQELVTVTNVASSPSTVTAVFANAHILNAQVSAAGVFPEGILSSSTATQLNLFGDINGDGNPVYVRYTCDTAAGTFSRSVTPISAGAVNPPVVLVQNLVANPGGSPCFQYAPDTVVGGFTFRTSVALTLTVQSSERDPQTGAFQTMTKSFWNLTPRNIVAGVNLATVGQAARLQPTPPGLATW